MYTAGVMDPSTSQLPTSFSKYHHPYFTPTEVEYFSERQRGKLSVSQEEKARQQACGFIEAVGSKIGLSVSLSAICMSCSTDIFYRASVRGRLLRRRRACTIDFICSFQGKTLATMSVVCLLLELSDLDALLGCFSRRVVCLDEDARYTQETSGDINGILCRSVP